MHRYVMILIATTLAVGCTRNPTAHVPVAPGTTIEVYATSATASPNTTSAIDPSTSGVIHLVNPPVITTADVATVAKAKMEIDTAANPAHTSEIPSLEIVLTPEGAKKMLAATTEPSSRFPTS